MLSSFWYFNGMISWQRSWNLFPTLGEQHEAGLGWVLITNFSEFSLEDPSWEPSSFLTLASSFFCGSFLTLAEDQKKMSMMLWTTKKNALRLDFWYVSLLRIQMIQASKATSIFFYTWGWKADYSCFWIVALLIKIIRSTQPKPTSNFSHVTRYSVASKLITSYKLHQILPRKKIASNP